MIAALHGVRFRGLAVAVPRGVEEVIDSDYSDDAARRKFLRITGVERRHLCRPEQHASDLAREAADRLLDALDWDRSEVGALVFVTQTPDMVMPATACILQQQLGLGCACGAFDVNLGCSGYTYGLRLVGSMLSEKGVQRALLLVGDSAGRARISSKRERVPPLFGSAAAATALEWDAGAPPLLAEMMTDGSGWDAISERRPGGKPPLSAENFTYEETEEGSIIIDTRHRMKGEDVFNFSVREVPAAVKRMLAAAGVHADDVDAFVFHQANRMINEFIRKRLSLEAGKTPSSLADFGNTSSASIPVTLVHQLRERLESEPLSLVLCGFGVGLSWCTTFFRTDGVTCLPLIEQ